MIGGEEMIEINGAHGEGGGQILRSSLSLSALLGRPMHIDHIRAQRGKPGLRPQHLTAVEAIADITLADLQGATRDSTAITLSPKGLRAGRFHFNIPTAGALTLVLQTIFLPLSFAPGSSQVTLTGGTHVPWSPTYHYLQGHWLPFMIDCGFRAEVNMLRAGFYPQGGGQVQLKVLPAQTLLPYICVERGELNQIRGLSGVANLDDDIARRQKHQALRRLYPLCEDVKIKSLRLPSHGKGTFILIRADFSNHACACYTALGAPGKPAERVADEAVDQLLAFLATDGCVDQYLADQMLLPLALIDGLSSFRTNAITQHLLTNAHVIQQFLPINIQIDGGLNEPGLIRIHGMNHRAL
jgi:RNA 3'-phosphate cyclase